MDLGKKLLSWHINALKITKLCTSAEWGRGGQRTGGKGLCNGVVGEDGASEMDAKKELLAHVFKMTKVGVLGEGAGEEGRSEGEKPSGWGHPGMFREGHQGVRHPSIVWGCGVN